MFKKINRQIGDRNAQIAENNERIMNNVRGIPKRKGGKPDFWLFATIIALALFGLYMVLSTTYYGNLVEGISPFSTFFKQSVFFVMGIGVMLVLMLIDDYTWLKSWAIPLWVAGIISLLLVRILGTNANGAGRWIKLGPITIQPSEFVKYIIVITLAAWIHTAPFPAKNDNKTLRIIFEWLRYLIQLLCFIIPVIFIFFQPAMSMSVVIVVVCMAMIFMSGMDWGRMGITVAVGLVAVIAGLMLSDFRRERILSFIAGNSDTLGTGLQPTQAKYAFASGNIFGKGMNYSRQKYGFLPMSDTDFIFAIIGEEFGFIGVILLVAAYVFIFWRGMRIAKHARCRFGAYTAAGITLIITLQALINMMVATGIMPVTGQALPLISQGGSSLISHLMAFGILLNISKDSYA